MSPCHLFLALLMLNALALSYAGLFHDARLYGFQVLNRVEMGRFADDLYLRYGSQDRYSLFSPLAAPLVRLLGLPVAFFLLYLAGSALFFLALQRLFLALVPNRWAAVGGLLFVAVNLVPFGGLRWFHVNENFLTPRLPAVALVLFGLERLYCGRAVGTLALLLAALALHPLMALGGWLVFLGWLLTERLGKGPAAAVIGLLGVAAAVVLLEPALGTRLFGAMDEDWRSYVYQEARANFPLDWTLEDWGRILAALGIVLGACRPLAADRRAVRLLALLAMVAVLGLGAAVLAGELPYALLLQAQLYRMAWPVQLLQVPLGFLLAGRWWERDQGPSRVAAIALVGYLGALSFDSLGLCLFLFPFLALGWYGNTLRSRRPGWLWQSALASVLVGFGGAVGLRLVYLVQHAGEMAATLAPLEWARVVRGVNEPLFTLLLAVGFLLVLHRVCGTGWPYRVVLVALGLTVQGVFFLLPQTACYARYRPQAADLAFVQAFLATQPRSGDRPPAVYWPVGRLEYLWFDLRVTSYFDEDQIAGVLFTRAQEVEARRRAAVIRPFQEGTATQEDLIRFCREEPVDYVILRQRFTRTAAADNGTWFIYDLGPKDSPS